MKPLRLRRLVREEVRAELERQKVEAVTAWVRKAVDECNTPEVLTQLRDDVLGRLYNDGELNTIIRALARDEGEHAAKTYLAHLLGAKVTIEVGSVLDGVDPALDATRGPLAPPEEDE